MVRPKRIRKIFYKPNVTYFKPAGIPLNELRETLLNFEEIEAIRLVDKEEISQTESAQQMKISQSTLSRLLKEGRKKLANAIIDGKAIKIEGGNFEMGKTKSRLRAPKEKGMGRMNGPFSLGPEGFCICPTCKEKTKHITGTPCYQQKCPKCKTQMTRETK